MSVLSYIRDAENHHRNLLLQDLKREVDVDMPLGVAICLLQVSVHDEPDGGGQRKQSVGVGVEVVSDDTNRVDCWGLSGEDGVDAHPIRDEGHGCPIRGDAKHGD